MHTYTRFIQIGFLGMLVLMGLGIRGMGKKDSVSVFHANGTLTAQMQNFFAELGQNITSLEDANAFAQKNLLRVGERWDTQAETPIIKACKDREAVLTKALRDLGMVDQVRTDAKKFNYALLMGALRKRIEQRLDSVAQLQNEGYEFDHIVLLGGKRPLIAEEKEGLPADVDTESEMMKYLYDNRADIKKSGTIIVDTPMKADGRRPNTDDTLIQFQGAEKPGSCLVVSNNPYLFRQLKVARRILDQGTFPTSGAGAALDPVHVDIHILMDEFARSLYEEYNVFSAGK